MGTCLSKKKGSSSSSSSSSFSPVVESKSLSSSAPPELNKNNSANVISVFKPKLETDPQLNLEKDKKKGLPEKQEPVHEDEGGQVKKEIFIIKHRKSHDDRERNSKCPPTVHQNASVDGVAENEAPNNEAPEFMGANKMAPPASTPSAMGMGVVRTSSCTKEEVDAILIQCGRLSRSSSGKAASSSAGAGERRRRYSGSKRSYDFDHCDNDTISADDDQRRANNGTDNSNPCEDDGEKRRQHRPRDRQSPRKPSSSHGRRRTPSRERDQQQNQRSSSRERRVSRSPGRRSSDTSNPTSSNSASANAGNNNSNPTARPGKMVSVPPTVSSLVMDKSNNAGGGESGVKRISVKRNVGGDSGMVAGSRSAASPRSQSPARANGNGAAANSKALGENNPQQQPSLSRNSSRKAEQSPYRRNPLSEIDPNSLAYPQSANNNNKKLNVDVNDNTKSRSRSVGRNCKPKEQQEEEVIGHCPVTENIVVKTVVPSGIDNLKQSQTTLTRSRSSRRSRDLDINPEAMLNPEQSYTSLLLEDIQNFHQKNTATSPVSLPACVTKASSILEAVADLNSTNSSNLLVPFSDDQKSPPTCQSTKNDYNVSLAANHFGKRAVTDTKGPFVESEVVVNDDVLEPSFHKYVTVKRGGSVRSGGGSGADMEDQESSGSNSFTVSGQQNWGFSSSSWEPNSADSTDSWASRLNSREEEVQKSFSGWASEAGRDMEEARSKSNGKRRECDHQHSSGIGRGRLAANKSLHTVSVTAAATT